MEIEFNPSRIPSTGASQPVAKKSASATASAAAAFENTDKLMQSLKDLPMVRPEQVERAGALFANVQYPPDEMLNRIAHLLAMQMK